MVTVSPDAIQLAIGHAIRRRRVEAGISQDALASRVGLHRTYVGSVERGERNVSIVNLARLAAALGLPLSELIALAEVEVKRG